MWDCPRCGANVDDSAVECWGCAYPRSRDETAGTSEGPARGGWTCAKCGTLVEPGFEVCWKCGTSITGVEDPSFVTADDADATDDQDDPILGPEGLTLVCPKCRGTMREGFVADSSRQGPFVANVKPAVWVAGRPQPSFWTGTWSGDESYRLRAFRCDGCAYLEFYAGDPPG